MKISFLSRLVQSQPLSSFPKVSLLGGAALFVAVLRGADAPVAAPAAAVPPAPAAPAVPAPPPEKPYTGKPIAFAEVQPILKKYCYDCHGGTTTQSTRSGLSLSTAASALKGGRSGKPAITPGHVNASEAIRLIAVPSGGRGHMPQAPRGQPPVSLTPEEIQKLSDWVASGASFDLPAAPAAPAAAPAASTAPAAPKP